MSSYDLVIRGGTVIDGSGAEPRPADVAINNGVIAAVGSGLAAGREEIDASGLLVTPGFVDVHTHYDGHVTWENRLRPSSCHGVTTAIIGNCGVGFAPCRAEDHDTLIRLMDGVEDIPYPVLAEGLPWTWESFPEYLDLLASREFDMDVAGYLPHAALRVYVMGARGANREPATEADIQRMCELLEEALDAGAMGIATSRTLFHRSSDGKPIPTLDASNEELLALAATMGRKGRGVFQIVEDVHLPGKDINILRQLAETSGRPLTFSIGTGNTGPHIWPQLLQDLATANAEGVVIKGQVMPRAIGMMLGHELTLNPFYSTAGYRELAGLELTERLQALRDPERRTRILSEPVDPDPALVLGRMVRDFDHMFLLGDPPVYEQPWEQSIAGRARQLGVSPEALAYDLMLDGERGTALYLAMANYAEGSLDAVGTMLAHPDVLPGLGDGGAHAGTICDGSYSTFALSHWGRDRERGRLPLADLVHRLSRATALFMGLEDRGLLAAGYKADLNVIDFERLALHAPEVTYDLPGNGRRLVQRAEGYVATVVNGVPVYRNGETTGTLPGRLVRGAQAAPG
ncbi:amidohydrolase family protein [Haliea sp. E1-2-M8]|uniref:N-acyl-D-amino-acid deacylase family protein n=1 Tax=Haliea sp. E1-2-M8 TaxID=3064706 RepID=UPI002724EFC5|nr:amidohydrolase family protein [Haliea sp. E1-2-M8]MDO8863114.1 amidohydrolase family protein [Haliea sp. E1-2-M8]